jgi:hypothetical protein
MADLTELEKEIIELAIRLVQSRYAVEEAIIQQEFKRKVNLLIKARRDSHANPQT